MISHRHRCIYVWVPKCGSTAVADWFAMHGGGRRIIKPWWYGGLLMERTQRMTRALNAYPGYAAFTFVRDPYERFVSLYLHASRIAARERAEGRGPPSGYGTLREFAELCREVLDDFRPLWGRDASDFFRAHAGREYGPTRIRLEHMRFVADHVRPQVDHLPDCNPHRLFGIPRVSDAPLSFIGRVEDMAADWRRLGDMLGLPGVALAVRNAAGGDADAGRGGRYRAHYDAAARRLVEAIYAADLAFTGCRFEDGRSAGFPVLRERPGRPNPPVPAWHRRVGRFLSRLHFALESFEVGIECRVRRSARLRRLLRPLKRLRGLPR